MDDLKNNTSRISDEEVMAEWNQLFAERGSIAYTQEEYAQALEETYIQAQKDAQSSIPSNRAMNCTYTI